MYKKHCTCESYRDLMTIRPILNSSSYKNNYDQKLVANLSFLTVWCSK